MSTASFYSDRTRGPQPRILEELPVEVWRGIVGLISRRVDDGSLAREFPVYGCDYFADAITATNRNAFNTALETLVPELRRTQDPWPTGEMPLLNSRQTPSAPVALDVVEFVLQHIAEPVKRYSHQEVQHEHLEFDQLNSRIRGQRQFRHDIELIFARNSIAFTVGDDMKVGRLGPPEARPLLSDFAARTGDAKLDDLLGDAHRRFLSRNPQDRVDALEKLWDAFERLKTLEIPTDKKASVQQLLAKAAGGDALFQAHLDTECTDLTKIGNGFQIRHFEVTKQPLPAPSETSVDYLFTRMLSLIAYLLRTTGRA